MAEHRFVFVGGLHRSGTTPLADALATHDEISALSGTGVPMDEGQHLQNVYPSAYALGGPGRFGFRPEAHLTERSPLVSASTRDALWRAWCPYWDVGHPVLLEKSPPNLIRTRFLQAVFPGARFVIIVRHPAVTALATAKWTGVPLRRMVRHWTVCHQLLLDDAEHIDDLCIVRYEDLVDAPDSVLPRISSFLEVDSRADPNVIVPALNDRYLVDWKLRHRWLGLSAGDVAAQFGYRFDHPGRLEPVGPKVARVAVLASR